VFFYFCRAAISASAQRAGVAPASRRQVETGPQPGNGFLTQGTKNYTKLYQPLPRSIFFNVGLRQFAWCRTADGAIHALNNCGFS
jgi:hypothetical protein